YHELLADIEGVERPGVMQGNEHVWHLYVIRVPDRDRVLQELNEEGIGAGVHYPKPLHLQPAFQHLGYKEGEFPVAEQAAREVLSLPIHPHITEEQQDRVVAALKAALHR